VIALAPAPRLAVPEQLDPACLASFDPEAVVIDLAGNTMGTGWRVRLAAPRTGAPADLRGRITARLDGLVAEMSHWEPGSLLARYNRAEPSSWTALPDDFAQVLTHGAAVWASSGHAFDPALGRVTDAWGLGPRRVSAPPAQAQIAEARAHAGWGKVQFDSVGKRLWQPGGLWLDLSGIAKGYAVDAVADLLADMGLHHALVEIGGECVGRGFRPDGDPWWVDCEVPQHIALPGLRIALHQLAIATSGDYLAGAHTIDPATGRPAIHRTTLVTVLHDRCVLADAWASALSVLEYDAARAMAEREALAARLVTREGEEWLSPAMLRLMA
jgi:thiamine biosynthesis lipoprotein